MTIDRETFIKIVDTLEPFMITEREQATFIQEALFDPRLLSTIQIGGASRNFTTQLVRRVIDYGELEAGKPAVVLLLEYAKLQRGVDKSDAIDDLITRVLSSESIPMPPPISISKSNPPDSSQPVNFTDQTINGYLLLERVGAGGFGEVYRAEHIRSGDIVAFKLTLENAMSWPAFDKRFAREVEFVQGFDHAHIVKYRDHGQYHDKPYLVIEWLNGGNLREKLDMAFGGLAVPKVAKVCEDMCRALDYVHKRHVIHRDLKPENIMLNEHDTYILTDFGIAKPLGNYTELTASGVRLGTLNYAAPEQLSSPNITFQVDIYALGLIIHELFMGQYPYAGLAERLREPLPSLVTVLGQGGLEMDKVLEKATAINPNNRYKNIFEFYRDFNNALT